MAAKSPLSPSLPAVAIAFRPEFLDFRRGIRVGNLEDNERLTRILKLGLEARYGQPFVTERWGRGVYWQWIGYLPRANRTAKPISNNVSFGCSKFFVMIDTDEHLFKSGMQVERGYLRAPREYRDCVLRKDWDWWRLIRTLTPTSPMEKELKRLLREGFEIQADSWESPLRFSQNDYPGARKLREALGRGSKSHWCGFQLYYPMAKHDVENATGLDLVESMLAVFHEVTPAMNQCMQVRLEEAR